MFDRVKSSSSSDSCTVHDLSENAQSPIFGTYTFFEFNRILGGACVAFASLVIIVHLFNHATHLSVPREQLKIMRVMCLIPLYGLWSILSISAPKANVYINPWLGVFESSALVAYFLLLCEYVSPHQEEQAGYFNMVEISDKRAREKGIDGETWFKRRYVMVFQYPAVALLCAIATVITQAAGIYCQYQTSLHHAKLWIQIIRNVSQFSALLSIFLVATTLKSSMPQHKPIRKLVALKLVVALTFLQGIIFWILDDTNVLKTSDTLTYADLNIGIPNLLICIEMVPISFVMAWSYPVKPYLHHSDPERMYNPSYQGGLLGHRALLGMMNPSDTAKGVVRAVRMMTKGSEK